MNPGCGCQTCRADQAPFWPPRMVPEKALYWSFMWHCARGYGWSDWYEYGDELV